MGNTLYAAESGWMMVMTAQHRLDQGHIDRRQCVGGLSAAALLGLAPQSAAAATVLKSAGAPALGNLLGVPAPSDAALFLQAYLQDTAS